MSERESTVGIHLDRLPTGRSDLHLDHHLVREDQILQGDRVEGFEVDVSGDLAIDTMDQKVLIHGEFTARRTMVCHRSGRSFELDYPVAAEIVVFRTPQRGDGPVEEDDNWVIQQSSGIVDLTEALLEAVVLDEPQRVVHPDHENDPVIEENENDEDDAIDPRWEALRELREGDGPGDGSGGD